MMSAKSHQRGSPASIATGSNKRARENRRPVIALPRPPRLAGDWRDSHGSPSVAAHPCPVQHQISDLRFADQHALDPGLSPCGASVSVDGAGANGSARSNFHDPLLSCVEGVDWLTSISSRCIPNLLSRSCLWSLCCNAHTQTREEKSHNGGAPESRSRRTPPSRNPAKLFS